MATVLEMSSTKTLQDDDSEKAPSEGFPEYTDNSKLGFSFVFILLFWTCIIFGCELGISTLFKIVAQEVQPFFKVCECPINAKDFGTDTVYFDGCVDNSTAEFQKFNSKPQNQSIQVDGWFGSSQFTRENLNEKKMMVYGQTTFSVENVTNPPYLYRCPTWRPLWWSPVDWVGVILFCLVQLSVMYSVATSFIIKTEIFPDRVQVTYFGGQKMAAPLNTIVGEPVSHDAKGLLPVRECALNIKTTEIITFSGSKSNAGITKVWLETDKDGKRKTGDFRVEPKEKNKFLSILKSALSIRSKNGITASVRQAIQEENLPVELENQQEEEKNYYDQVDFDTLQQKEQHYYSSQIPDVTNVGNFSGVDRIMAEEQTNDFIQVQWKGRHTLGYWLRSLLRFFVYWVCIQFGVSVILFLARELLNPDRPRAENEFSNAVLTFDVGSYLLFVWVLSVMMISSWNGLPTVAGLSNTALFFHLNRVNSHCSLCDDTSRCLIVPRRAVVSTIGWNSLNFIETVIRSVFVEWGTPVVKASEFFTIVRSKKFLLIQKYCAKDVSKGKEIEPGYASWQFLIPGNKAEQESFLNGLRL
jgi:hypothetical protein